MESQNQAQEPFGFERTADTVRDGCNQGLSAEAILELLLGTVREYEGSATQEQDDQTIVVLAIEA
jgi:serine phosphatase RsbU (regulator of sigma subunit)